MYTKFTEILDAVFTCKNLEKMPTVQARTHACTHAQSELGAQKVFTLKATTILADSAATPGLQRGLAALARKSPRGGHRCVCRPQRLNPFHGRKSAAPLIIDRAEGRPPDAAAQVVTPSHILERPMPTLDAERERLFDDLISELADRVRHAPAEAQARRSGHGRPPERERGRAGNVHRPCPQPPGHKGYIECHPMGVAASGGSSSSRRSKTSTASR
jgi:hypothetical protein